MLLAGRRRVSVQRVRRAACWTKGKLSPLAEASKVMRQRASVRLRLSSQVWASRGGSRGGKRARSALVESLEFTGHTGLVAFDGQEVVSPLVLHHDARCL